VTAVTPAFTRRLRVPLLALLFLLVSACTKEQSCKQTLNQLVCTESSRWPSWLTDLWPKLWPLLVIAMLFGLAGLIFDSKAKPQSILISNLSVGDRVQGPNGGVVVVRSVGWMSADELEVTWSDGGSQRFARTATVIRLPPLKG
jgi:hypothetical protein